MTIPSRCPWAKSPLMLQYHDTEWGTPLHDDRRLFEFLILEGAQAGLSWETILKKRDGYRQAFDQFDAEKISRYTPRKQQRLMENAGIIRNRLKVAAAIANAKSFLTTQKEFGTFDRYVWAFVNDRPVVSHFRTMKEVPARTPAAEAMSGDLLKRGFKFVGPTICYAFMQATGMVNDHLTSCYRHPTFNSPR
jgi:DNA-3-methyladenine glycosylase I